MLKSFAAYVAVAAVAIAASVSMAQSQPELPDYLDDRSTPEQLIHSYFNALNRSEYVRAFSYFAPDVFESFDAMQFKYDDVVKLDVTIGQSAQESAAGANYYQFPVEVEYEHAEGQHHIERGCISIRWPRPQADDRPPFEPMAITGADLHAEGEAPQGFAPAKCFTPPNRDLPSPVFLDDRSTPEQTIRSYYNALERGEWGRASNYLGGFPTPEVYTAWWQSQDAIRVTGLQFGTPSHYSTAGSISYGVPVAITGVTGNENWVDVGCIGAYWELPNDEAPYPPITIDQGKLKRQPAGEPVVLPSCDD
jgi:hypothetical protein